MWAKHAAEVVAKGTSGCQTAIPNGKYPGDPWFITDQENNIIFMFAWDGKQWRHPFETYGAQK